METWTSEEKLILAGSSLFKSIMNTGTVDSSISASEALCQTEWIRKSLILLQSDEAMRRQSAYLSCEYGGREQIWILKLYVAFQMYWNTRLLDAPGAPLKEGSD